MVKSPKTRIWKEWSYDKKTSRIVAVIMLIIAIIFFVVALNNPQASFPWNNIITYILYGTYIIIMIILFIAPFKRKK